ncbi:hypothetical protein ACE1CD_15530 [Aerosakkonema sp. BLCC-F183]|uniref:hypothetical protein n=1 Tax=Aerosakkonema sp. BLCC-F183 TaxID=3342834 RepID=UPI0035B72126
MPAGKLGFTAAEYQIRENGTWITQKVGVVRSNGTDGAVSVRVTNSSSATPGRATRKVDFIADNPATSTGTSQLLSWAAGESGIKYCDFTITNDDLVEGNEFIPLSLGTYKGDVSPGEIIQANLIIIDDDSPIPAHRWNGTALQFQNPDGTWGDALDLKGQGADSNSGISEKTIRAELDINAYGNSTIDLTEKLLSIHQLTASSPTRIRGYLSTETRKSDRSRPTYLYPDMSESPGILFDVVLGVEQTSLSLKLCPQVLVSKQPVFVAVDNLLPQSQKINLSIVGIA